MLRRVLIGGLLLLAGGAVAMGTRAGLDVRLEPAGTRGSGAVATPLWSGRRVPDLLVRPIATRRLDAALEPVTSTVAGEHCLAVRDTMGRPLHDENSTRALVPGSNVKLITAAAALEELGASLRFATTIAAATPPRDGVVEGDLFLVGGGDPLIVSENYLRTSRYGPYPHTPLDALADAVIGAGVRRISGSIRGDESRYDQVRSIPTWPSSYLSEGQVGPLTALSVNDARTYPVLGPGGPTPRPAADPPAYAAAALTEVLRQRGVVVEGPPASGVQPPGATVVATVESQPLAAIVAEMLTFSDNNTAELLVKELGARQEGSGTTAAGLGVMRSELAETVGGTNDFTLADGSGLDRSNRVSCAALARLLVRQGPDGDLASGLAVGGETGTLRDRFRNSPERGKVRAKTGTLRDVTALSGWVPGVDGRPLAFSFLLNTGERRVGPGDLALQERIVEAIASYPQQPPTESLAPRPVAGKAGGVDRSGG